MDEQQRETHDESYSYEYDAPAAGKTPPRRPRTQRGVNWERATSLPFVIASFALGLWPLGVFLICKGLSLEQTQVRRSAATKKPAKKAAGKRKKKKDGAVAYLFWGTILSVCGIAATGDAVDMILWSGSLSGWVEDLWIALTMLTAGGALLYTGITRRAQARRFPHYRNVIRERTTVSFDELAAAMGVSRRKVVRDLRRMMERGLLGETAYLDMGRLCYVADGEEMERERSAQQPPAQTVAAEESVPEETAQGYEVILQNIRVLNDRIADEELSRQIDRIEDISRHIFREVERCPEKEKQISTLMNYYLPTTQKLLDTYATFEEAGVDGERTSQAKRRIETTMERIVRGFEKQLDELYRTDVLDVEADIRVMEEMLRRDGADEDDTLRLKL